MPPNPERQAKMRAKREAMDNDPALQDMIDYQTRRYMDEATPTDFGQPTTPAARAVTEPVARPAPPPLNQPPMGRPSVPGGPQVRAPSMRSGRGGGLPPRRGGAPSDQTMQPRQVNPLQLSPNSPFKYAQGGSANYGQDYRKGK